MEIPEKEKYDDYRISFETAREEYNFREELRDEQKFPELQSETRGCFGLYTLSLTENGGRKEAQPHKAAAAATSLKLAFRQNQQKTRIRHTYNEEHEFYVPDEASTIAAFEEHHQEGNAYGYYVVNWRRCQFQNTHATVYYGNCPQCYCAYPLGKQCTTCANQVAKVIYFREPGPRVFEPAIPHRLGQACGHKGQQFVIDEYELLDNKQHQASHLQLPRANVGYEIHTLERFFGQTSQEFRSAPHFETNTCDATMATPAAIKASLRDVMLYWERNGFTEAQVQSILGEQNHEYAEEYVPGFDWD